MKAILEFDLDDFEDRNSHKRAINATNAYLALYKIDDMLRRIVKYDEDISPGYTIELINGSHTLTEHESVLLNTFASIIRGATHQILINQDINMGDLE